MSRWTLPVLLVAAALLLAGCAGSARPSAVSKGDSGAGRLPAKTAMAGPVEVNVTPERLDEATAVFSVELDNHEVDLTGDYTKGSSLTVGGRAWDAPQWTGDGPGGHHRAGTLTFKSAGAPNGALVLRIAGLPSPVTVRWAGR